MLHRLCIYNFGSTHRGDNIIYLSKQPAEICFLQKVDHII